MPRVMLVQNIAKGKGNLLITWHLGKPAQSLPRGSAETPGLGVPVNNAD